MVLYRYYYYLTFVVTLCLQFPPYVDGSVSAVTIEQIYVSKLFYSLIVVEI